MQFLRRRYNQMGTPTHSLRTTVNDTLPRAGPPSEAAPTRRIALIAAIADNGVIGADNGLPWRLPEDLKHFRRLTPGHSIIMGRKTWESIGKPLYGRQNIVVSRNAEFRADGAQVADSFEHALALPTLPDPVFVIGGAAIYRAALPSAQLLYLTEIRRSFAGDAHFPEYAHEAWQEISRESRRMDGAQGFTYDFAAYERSSR
jgi:dihydrofolate reductase